MSFSDIVSLISLIIGILAVTMIPFGIYLEKQNSRLASAHEQSQEAILAIRKQQEHHALMLEATSQLATSSRSCQQFCEGMIHRLLKADNTSQDKVARFESALSKYDLSIERAQKKLEMLSGDKQVQLSAFKALAERLASHDCLDAMRLVAGNDSDLKSYVARTRKRLHSSVQ